MTYSVELRPHALRMLRKLDSLDQARIRGAIILLSEDPRPPRSRKLRGREGYRVRAGDFCAICAIKNSLLAILVIAIGHRREVDRGIWGAPEENSNSNGQECNFTELVTNSSSARAKFLNPVGRTGRKPVTDGL